MIIALEPTNTCNLKCLHCIRDKQEDRHSIPLDVVQKVLREAKAYGLERYIALTGGEPTMHPQFDELLEIIVREGFKFHIITNGFRFRSKVLPVLLRPHIRKQLHHIAISLDGALAKTHDANRGAGSFQAAMEMAALCKLKDIPINLITVINNFNKTELTEIALLGSGLGAISHLFGPLHATQLSVERELVPSPEETKRLMSFVIGTLATAMKMPIVIGTGNYCNGTLMACDAFKGDHVNADFDGNAIFCCTLSHPADDSKPSVLGEEVLTDLKSETLGVAIAKAKHLAAKLTEERLKATDAGKLTELDYFPCWWCLKRFGKLGWLQNFPDSPWAGTREGTHAAPVTQGAGAGRL